ncbi:MAG: TolC family outer membrane protein [Azonexus sp.]|nr:TolC family outer membrane protein [Azonexus sp.]
MKRLVWLLSASLLASPLRAADLMQIYREAQANDATFAAARSTLEAGRERTPQARAGLLPTLSLSANSFWNENQLYVRGSGNTTPANFNSNGYTLTLSQPLFRWQNWVAYDQSKFQVAQAEANFVQAGQDLILRTAQAYFDVLYAIESLKAVQANKVSIEQQLESAKRNFEVGTSTIVDAQEAQARFDLAIAQEIAAESDLEVRRQALQAIIGKEAGPLAPFRKNAEIPQPQPADMKQWAAAAENDNINVQLQMATLEIASREVDRQRAGHYPTVDLVVNKGKSTAFGQIAGGQLETDFENIGVQLNLPIFQGGLVVSRQSEASANRAAAESTLEQTRRNAALQARQQYLGATNGLAQVRALKAALISSQSSLESNRLGFEVGVRINIDVLNADNQVFLTRRDLAKAVLETLMSHLRLKSAVGTLSDDDVVAANALLDPGATAQ